MLAGIRQLHVTHNVLEVNARRPVQMFRCGTVHCRYNTDWGGEDIPGWNTDKARQCEEPETVLEDAFILGRLQRNRAA
jgi:hypothetical protein